MPKDGIHSCVSTNWKSAVVGSKSTHSRIDSANVISDVHRAAMRALRATTSGVPRTQAMNTAPTTGRKVTSDRIGQLAVMAPSPEQQIPGDQQHDADQHGKGIVVDVAGLQQAGAARELERIGGERIGPEAVDDGAVALLPEPPADREARAHEQ